MKATSLLNLGICCQTAANSNWLRHDTRCHTRQRVSHALVHCEMLLVYQRLCWVYRGILGCASSAQNNGVSCWAPCAIRRSRRAHGHGERSCSVPFGIGSLVHRRIFLYLIVTKAGVLWHLLCKVVFLMLSYADPCLCRKGMRHESYIPAQLGHLLSHRGKQQLATS